MTTEQHNGSTKKIHVGKMMICKHGLFACEDCNNEIDWTERDATTEELESQKNTMLWFKLHKIEREDGLKSKIIKFENGYQRVFFVDDGHGEPSV